jgi:hypothetical protein
MGSYQKDSDTHLNKFSQKNMNDFTNKVIGAVDQNISNMTIV